MREALDVLLFCENLSAQSHEYLMERPSLERMAETVQRIEETMTDRMEEPIAPLGAAVAVGPAHGRAVLHGDERAARAGGDPLLEAVAGGMKDLLAQDCWSRAARRVELPAARGEKAWRGDDRSYILSRLATAGRRIALIKD